MNLHRYPALFTCLAVVLAATGGLIAQNAPAPKVEFPALSPAATLKQRVGLTNIEVNYSRPSVRGRKIFGGLEPYGSVWRTGANAATRISFSTPVKLNGADLAAGTYELFTIPNPTEWTVIIHKNASEWGAYTYDAKDDVARIAVKPVALAQPVETFTIDINDIRDDSAMLNLSWEKTRVPVKIALDVTSTLVPQIEAVMSSDATKKPYFQSAMFYLEHNLDLKKAAEWFDAAIAAQPDSYFMYYHKARLLAKVGDKVGAIASARKSIELASKNEGAIKAEYTRLNETLISSLK